MLTKNKFELKDICYFKIISYNNNNLKIKNLTISFISYNSFQIYQSMTTDELTL